MYAYVFHVYISDFYVFLRTLFTFYSYIFLCSIIIFRNFVGFSWVYWNYMFSRVNVYIFRLILEFLFFHMFSNIICKFLCILCVCLRFLNVLCVFMLDFSEKMKICLINFIEIIMLLDILSEFLFFSCLCIIFLDILDRLPTAQKLMRASCSQSSGGFRGWLAGRSGDEVVEREGHYIGRTLPGNGGIFHYRNSMQTVRNGWRAEELHMIMREFSSTIYVLNEDWNC